MEEVHMGVHTAAVRTEEEVDPESANRHFQAEDAILTTDMDNSAISMLTKTSNPDLTL